MLLQLLILVLLVCYKELLIKSPLTAHLAEQNGSYLQDGHIDNDALKPHAKDKETAVKLWALTEKLVGQKFDYSGGSSL